MLVSRLTHPLAGEAELEALGYTVRIMGLWVSLDRRSFLYLRLLLHLFAVLFLLTVFDNSFFSPDLLRLLCRHFLGVDLVDLVLELSADLVPSIVEVSRDVIIGGDE